MIPKQNQTQQMTEEFKKGDCKAISLINGTVSQCRNKSNSISNHNKYKWIKFSS